jgi:hypothetical protein
MSAHAIGTIGFQSLTSRPEIVTPNRFTVTYQVSGSTEWILTEGEYTTNNPESRANEHAQNLRTVGAIKTRVNAFHGEIALWSREDYAVMHES